MIPTISNYMTFQERENYGDSKKISSGLGEEDDPGETSKSGGGISGQNRAWIQAECGGKAKQSYTKHSGCRMGENICKSCLIKDLYVEYKFKQRMFKTQ